MDAISLIWCLIFYKILQSQGVDVTHLDMNLIFFSFAIIFHRIVKHINVFLMGTIVFKPTTQWA